MAEVQSNLQKEQQQEVKEVPQKVAEKVLGETVLEEKAGQETAEADSSAVWENRNEKDQFTLEAEQLLKGQAPATQVFEPQLSVEEETKKLAELRPTLSSAFKMSVSHVDKVPVTSAALMNKIQLYQKQNIPITEELLNRLSQEELTAVDEDDDDDDDDDDDNEKDEKEGEKEDEKEDENKKGAQQQLNELPTPDQHQSNKLDAQRVGQQQALLPKVQGVPQNFFSQPIDAAAANAPAPGSADNMINTSVNSMPTAKVSTNFFLNGGGAGGASSSAGGILQQQQQHLLSTQAQQQQQQQQQQPQQQQQQQPAANVTELLKGLPFKMPPAAANPAPAASSNVPSSLASPLPFPPAYQAVSTVAPAKPSIVLSQEAPKRERSKAALLNLIAAVIDYCDTTF
jgi:hypothetical protein